MHSFSLLSTLHLFLVPGLPLRAKAEKLLINNQAPVAHIDISHISCLSPFSKY